MSHPLWIPRPLSFAETTRGGCASRTDVAWTSPCRSFGCSPSPSRTDRYRWSGDDGKELWLIDSLANLPPAQAEFVRDEIATREFVSVVRRVTRASSTTLPARWDIETDRGTVTATLRDEDAFRNCRGGSCSSPIPVEHGFWCRKWTLSTDAAARFCDSTFEPWQMVVAVRITHRKSPETQEVVAPHLAKYHPWHRAMAFSSYWTTPNPALPATTDCQNVIKVP